MPCLSDIAPDCLDVTTGLTRAALAAIVRRLRRTATNAEVLESLG
jgi:hypothetical protein